MTLLFAFPEQKTLAASLLNNGQLQSGEFEWRRFPDGESYIRVLSDVRDQKTIILCSLDKPDDKTLALLFLARTLRELGAQNVILVAPYLGYMRQDKRFKDGEAVTSSIFAQLVSGYIDELVTFDPHLHRHKALGEIYSCNTRVLTASSLISTWVKDHIQRPLIIGPDMESEQWVKEVADPIKAPYVILEKKRSGDRDVSIKMPDIQGYKGYTPVLVDDIISTGMTLIETIKLLQQNGFDHPTCLATHGVFAEGAYENLLKTGAVIVTCNTIPHSSNGMDIASLLQTIL